ncbi:hypothetical protein ABPG72_009740 [Tetrahymena utriculariae]
MLVIVLKNCQKNYHEVTKIYKQLGGPFKIYLFNVKTGQKIGKKICLFSQNGENDGNFIYILNMIHAKADIFLNENLKNGRQIIKSKLHREELLLKALQYFTYFLRYKLRERKTLQTKRTKDILISNFQALGGKNKTNFNSISSLKDQTPINKRTRTPPQKQQQQTQQYKLKAVGIYSKHKQQKLKKSPSRAISRNQKIITRASGQLNIRSSSFSIQRVTPRRYIQDQLIKYKEKKKGVQLNFILFCERRRRRKRILKQLKKESKLTYFNSQHIFHFQIPKSTILLKPNSPPLQCFSLQKPKSSAFKKDISKQSSLQIQHHSARSSSAENKQLLNLLSKLPFLPTQLSNAVGQLLDSAFYQLKQTHNKARIPKIQSFQTLNTQQIQHSAGLHPIKTQQQPIQNMEDETQFLYQNNFMRQNTSFQVPTSAESFEFQQKAQDLSGFDLKSKQRFPFQISSFECIGKKIVLGSDQGSLYAYQMVQAPQKQSFKLLYFESNAHSRSPVVKLLDLNEPKSRKNECNNSESNNLNRNFNRNKERFYNDDSMKNQNQYQYNQYGESYENNFNIYCNSTDPFSSSRDSVNSKNSQKIHQHHPLQIISCGLYDRKLILWEINGKFEKIAQSQMFKTFIYSLSVDENFVFVATFRKIYALNLSNLQICMKFGVPNYKYIEFQFSSVACLPLLNSNILIAGTDNYLGTNQFLSLWEYPKEYRQIQQGLDQLMQEEEEDLNAQTQAVVNDIEDLDNFDLDGDFNEAPAASEAKPKKKKRLSFWKPNILEHCHSTRVRQLKCFQNCPQFISVSVTEINIWRIIDGNQVQSMQLLSFQNQMNQQIGYNISSPNLSTAPLSFKAEIPAAQQVFSLKFNKDRRIYTNAIIEKKTNNVLFFVDSEVLSFDSSNFRLNYHQNLHSNSQISQLYLNSLINSCTSYNEEIGKFQQMYPHNNHYVLLSNPQNEDLNTQFATKYTIAACEFEQNKRTDCNKYTKTSENWFISNQINIQAQQDSQTYSQNNWNINSNFYQNEQQQTYQPIHESKIEEEDEYIQMSPKLTPRKKKLLQSPISKPLSQIPTSVPPVLKYSTAHLIPSTASYTILMNKLKQIEQTNNAAKLNNSSMNSLRRSSQSSANIPAITFRKPYLNGPRSNSKCIKKQLKRHVKYCNKKKKMKQNLVKVFANQNNLNTQKKEINPQSLLLVQSQTTNPSQLINDKEQTIQIPLQEQYQIKKEQDQSYSQLNMNYLNSNTAKTNISSSFSANNISKSNNKTSKTFIVAQDSESSLGFYSIQ